MARWTSDGLFFTQSRLEHASLLWQFVFCKESHLEATNAEHVVLEIDDCLVRFEHVQSKEEVNVATLHDRERARKVEVGDLHLGGVYATQNLCGTYATRDTSEPPVEETHDATLFCALGAHCIDSSVNMRKCHRKGRTDSLLSAAVYKRFQWSSVNLHRDALM